VPVFYYVCPQIWAWRQGRVKKMADRVDRRVVIFPFEVDFYRRRGLTADYVGHPLLDEMDPPLPRPEARELAGLDRERPLVLLMPGSRRKVIARNWPVMSGVVRRLARQRPDLDFAAARAPNVPLDYLTEVLGPDADLVRIETGSRLLQNAADAALVSSGTATLETALMETPMAVTYRAHPITVMAARRLISIDYASIVNLIAGREVVPEFLQENARPDRMAAEMEELLEPGLRRREMIAGMREVRDLLGGPGASRRAAELLLETIGAP
jgi:lipid-A-disaccharide synthase